MATRAISPKPSSSIQRTLNVETQILIRGQTFDIEMSHSPLKQKLRSTKISSERQTKGWQSEERHLNIVLHFHIIGVLLGTRWRLLLSIIPGVTFMHV